MVAGRVCGKAVDKGVLRGAIASSNFEGTKNYTCNT